MSYFSNEANGMIKNSLICIVDYGVGNFNSIVNMFKYLAYDVVITNDISQIRSAKKLILAGVGSFDHVMQNLKELNLITILSKKVIDDKVPVLGICLGMQLFGNESEEGNQRGLGWIDAEVVKFNNNNGKLKVPHMGWNSVTQNKNSKLLYNMMDEPRFYFVHSYYMHCNNPQDILLRTHYGFDFTSAVEKDNIFGVQFHPEKSHKYGMKILQNFAEL